MTAKDLSVLSQCQSAQGHSESASCHGAEVITAAPTIYSISSGGWGGEIGSLWALLQPDIDVGKDSDHLTWQQVDMNSGALDRRAASWQPVCVWSSWMLSSLDL